MIKISGRHKSVPKELKRSLTQYLPNNAKVVMNDICSCRHTYAVGALKVVSEDGVSAKIRGYYGSGVVNFFVKFTSEEDRELSCLEINSGFI